jgi:hypothetical protein
MDVTSLASRLEALIYPSSHRSTASICSPKWTVVARKVGLSRAASLRFTGLLHVSTSLIHETVS